MTLVLETLFIQISKLQGQKSMTYVITPIDRTQSTKRKKLIEK